MLRGSNAVLSIAICTYNRADSLQFLLHQLRDAINRTPDVLQHRIEILVVDNNSTDHTRSVLDAAARHLAVKVLQEERQGLANARNCALRNFAGEAILFLDDDVSISTETLEEYLRALTELPGHDYFGGSIDVDWQGQRPGWLEDDSMPLLAGMVGYYRPKQGDADYDELLLGPYGANFMLRRSLIEDVGEFDPALGVSADSLARGEETDYFRRARKLGFNGKYLHRACVGHRFQHERLNLRHFYRYGIAKGGHAIEDNPEPGRLSAITMFALKGVWQLLKGRRDRFYQCVINIGIQSGRIQQARRLQRQGTGDD